MRKRCVDVRDMRWAIWQAVIVVYFATESAEASKQKRFLFWATPSESTAIEKEHSWFAHAARPSPYVNGTDYEISLNNTPDWRVEEYPMKKLHSDEMYKEFHRPYRLSPAFKQTDLWSKSGTWFYPNRDNPDYLNCYCATVYKRLTLLGTCAVITTRHILTTASSTEIVLRKHGENKHLEGILGAWYDNDANTFNSSMYMTPARIHYHPKFIMPDNVNASHPLPIYQDLAIWTSTHPFMGRFWFGPRAYICHRAGSFWMERATPVPGYYYHHFAFVVGFQFMMWYKKKPMPWFKYAMKTRSWHNPCPKGEWGWFFCIKGRFAMQGIDSGMMMHRTTSGISWLYDGLWAVGSFTMTLRANAPVHYFTPVENHDALEFMYNAYMGRLPYRYLDYRFHDTRDQPLLVHAWASVTNYDKYEGEEKNIMEPLILD